MPRNRLMNLVFPAAGLVKGLSYQRQPPYSTPDCQNVRVTETYERRARGGTRGGLKVALTKHADMGDDIRLLAVIPWVDGTTRKESIVAIENRDLFYCNDGVDFTAAAGGADAYGGKLSNAVVAGTTHLFASVKQQKLYIADPGATDGTDAQIRVFTPTTGAASTIADNTTTTGTMPDDCPLICTYRDRIVVAGPNHVWYMSRLCTPTDWNYGCDLDDPGRAVAGSAADAGTIGDNVTALIPHGDEHLVFGCQNSIWVLRGDPAYGGHIDVVSRDTGVLSGHAWCRTPEDIIVFLGRDGLYALPPGGTARPEPLSRDRLPDDLRGLDASANHISMGYSLDEAGFHISITPNTGTALGTHWFYDWRHKGFWPDVVPAAAQPTYYAQYAKDLTAQRELTIGTRGGYVLKFDDDTTTDQDGAGSTSSITSYVLIGPFFPAGSDYDRACLAEIYAVLDESSGDVTWSILVGEQAEQAVGASAFATGTWSAGRNASEHPRAGGVAFVVKINATTRWALESITARVQRAGKALVA